MQVNYATAGGTAVAGRRLHASHGTLTFLANQTTATFSVPILPGSQAHGKQDGRAVAVQSRRWRPARCAEHGDVDDHDRSRPNPSGPVDTIPPQVTGSSWCSARPESRRRLLVQQAPRPDRAVDLGNYGYYAIFAGPDGMFGTSDDGSIPLARPVQRRR